mgnify:FL=1|tara:strand:- start:2489 stop:3304 length:816 start_codon:yes stop_codon:yes gene_type:complete
MGSIGNTGRLAAFQTDVFNTGLDLGRCEINRNLGVYRSNDNAAIRQGQVVCLDANEELILPVNGLAPTGSQQVMGISKWNKLPGTGAAKMIDEPINFGAGPLPVTITLSRTAGVSGLTIYPLAGQEGTAGNVALVDGVDFTFAANGQVIGAGGMPLATTVFASYTFDMTQNDYDFQGRNFWNTLDKATVAENRLTVIQGAATLFTCEYYSGDTWAINDAVFVIDEGATGDPLCQGQVTNGNVGSPSANVIGRCIQVPSVNDAFLGFVLDVF